MSSAVRWCQAHRDPAASWRLHRSGGARLIVTLQRPGRLHRSGGARLIVTLQPPGVFPGQAVPGSS